MLCQAREACRSGDATLHLSHRPQPLLTAQLHHHPVQPEGAPVQVPTAGRRHFHTEQLLWQHQPITVLWCQHCLAATGWSTSGALLRTATALPTPPDERLDAAFRGRQELAVFFECECNFNMAPLS